MRNSFQISQRSVDIVMQENYNSYMLTQNDTIRLAEALGKISKERSLSKEEARASLVREGLYNEDGTRVDLSVAIPFLKAS